MEILALIPARGGSKGITGKNLVPLLGKALLSYTCEAAKHSTMLTRIIVSTDDQKIADAAESFGIDTPFLRPPELAGDTTPMLDVILHALETLKTEENFSPDIFVLLQPTSPLRTGASIDAAVRLLQETGADTVVSVVAVPHQFLPSSLMRETNGRLVPYLESGTGPLRRQDKEVLYARNGPAILVCKVSSLLKNGFYVGDTRAFVMSEKESVDIDTPFDLQLAEMLLKQAE